jgi:hypothetical protein
LPASDITFRGLNMQPTTPESDPLPPATGSPSTITGRCLCGAVTIMVAGQHDARIGACHCRMCQRWSGGLFLCFTAETSAVTVTGEVTRYRSSAFAERAFCPRCGSHLWFSDVEPGSKPTSYGLMPGLFDAAHDWPLRSEVYADRAMASVPLAGDHRRKSRAEYEAQNQFVEGDCGEVPRAACSMAAAHE